MTAGEGLSALPTDISEAKSHRIDARVQNLLTNGALSDAEAAALIDELITEAVPAKKALPKITVDPEPVDEWALDQPTPALSALAAAPPALTEDAYIPLDDYQDMGEHIDEGDVDTAIDPEDPDAWVDSPELWHPPAQEPLQIPENVSEIAPAAAVPEPPAPEPIQSRPVVAGSSALSPAGAGLPQRAKALWNRLSKGQKYGAIAAAILIVVVGGGINFTESKPSPLIQGPLPGAVTEEPKPGNDSGTPLQPDNLTPHCYLGWTDPWGAFSDEKGPTGGYLHAFICPGKYTPNYNSLDICFSKPVIIYSITVTPGYDLVEENGEDHWGQYPLITAIKWTIGTGEIIQQIVPTRGEGAVLTLKDRPATQCLSLTVQSTKEAPHKKSNGGLFGGPETKTKKAFAIGHLTILGRRAGGTT